MELRQAKPIHLRCPKCAYDFAYNSSYVERNIDSLKLEIADILAQIANFKANKSFEEVKRSAWHRNAKAALNTKQKQLRELKLNRKTAAQEIKLQTYELFKKKIMKEIGNVRCIEILKECEEELIYKDYDMAVQNHNNFHNV